MGVYECKAEALEARWMAARPEYADFCHDGALSRDGDGYRAGKYGLRILWLLKEAPAGAYGPTMQVRGLGLTSRSPGSSNRFWAVLGAYAYIINRIAAGKVPDWEDFRRVHAAGGYPLDCLAYVNIKKGNGARQSDWGDLEGYAQDDQDFINEQIEMLRPDVMVCGGTYQVYQRCICNGNIPSGAQSQAVYDSVNDRYVIDMPHPAARKKLETLFHDMAGRCGAIGEWLRCRAEGLPYFRK